jgi:hypothetical protein
LPGGKGQGHEQNTTGTEETLEMVEQLEDKKLFFLPVPVGPDALKASRALVESMRHDADFGILDGDKAPLKIRKLGHTDLLLDFGFAIADCSRGVAGCVTRLLITHYTYPFLKTQATQVGGVVARRPGNAGRRPLALEIRLERFVASRRPAERWFTVSNAKGRDAHYPSLPRPKPR